MMTMGVSSKLREYTQHLNQTGLLRARALTEPNDSCLISFDSNDYLSLLGDKRLTQAYEYGYKHYPSGSGASMLLAGYHANHQALEQAFAQFLNVDECIICSSGYSANLAVIALLKVLKVHCIIDKGAHASIYDGITLSHSSYSRFLHNDVANMVEKIMLYPHNSAVLTEGIFSMSGQIAALSAMSEITQSLATPLIVDEAHSFGVLGVQGQGAVQAAYLTQEEVPLRIIPLGKTFAAQGAIIAGKQEWVQGILQAGRSLIYSTAISPALAYGLLKTLEVVSQADERRAKLMQLISFFKNKIVNSPLIWSASDTAIQFVQLSCPYRARFYTEELKRQGFSCSLIRPPTVSRKSTGIRIVLNYKHTPEHINALLNQLHILYEHQPY